MRPSVLTQSGLDQITEIAEEAGRTIMIHYGEGDAVEVREKSDSSPVTVADEAAEAVILSALAKLTPDIPVVAEEAVAAGNIPSVEGGLFWLVDPLDGTKEFLSRNGEFTVNIALIQNGLPVMGVVHAPAMERTWSGVTLESGTSEAFVAKTGSGKCPIETREIPESGAIVVASRRHGSGEALDEFLGAYKVEDMVSAGSSVKFCLVAEARADLYPRFGRTMEWDTAAGHAVLRAAGGAVFAENGDPLTYGKAGFENPHFYAKGDPN